MGSREFRANASTVQPLDCLEEEALRFVAVAEQRPGTRFKAQRPISAACACHLAQLDDSIGRDILAPLRGAASTSFTVAQADRATSVCSAVRRLP